MQIHQGLIDSSGLNPDQSYGINLMPHIYAKENKVLQIGMLILTVYPLTDQYEFFDRLIQSVKWFKVILKLFTYFLFIFFSNLSNNFKMFSAWLK